MRPLSVFKQTSLSLPGPCVKCGSFCGSACFLSMCVFFVLGGVVSVAGHVYSLCVYAIFSLISCPYLCHTLNAAVFKAVHVSSLCVHTMISIILYFYQCFV